MMWWKIMKNRLRARKIVSSDITQKVISIAAQWRVDTMEQTLFLHIYYASLMVKLFFMALAYIFSTVNKKENSIFRAFLPLLNENFHFSFGFHNEHILLLFCCCLYMGTYHIFFHIFFIIIPNSKHKNKLYINKGKKRKTFFPSTKEKRERKYWGDFHKFSSRRKKKLTRYKVNACTQFSFSRLIFSDFSVRLSSRCCCYCCIIVGCDFLIKNCVFFSLFTSYFHTRLYYFSNDEWRVKEWNDDKTIWPVKNKIFFPTYYDETNETDVLLLPIIHFWCVKRMKDFF